MDEENEIKQLGTETGPKPLSSEAPQSEIEIDPKKKAQDKKTIVNFKDKNYIKNIVSTPKDGASDGASSSFSHSSSADNSSENLDEVRKRLAQSSQSSSSPGTEPVSLSSSGGGGAAQSEQPDDEDCEIAAELIIELIDWLMIMLIQWYAKDTDEKNYQSNEKTKSKLKKILKKMLVRMGKKYPLGVFFGITMMAMYFPAAKRAHDNRQKVLAEQERLAAEEAEKEAAREEARQSKKEESGKSKQRSIRSIKNDPEIQEAEQVA